MPSLSIKKIGKSNDKVKSEQTANECSLVIDEARRSDSGEYKVVLKNEVGEDEIPLIINVQGL